MNVAYSLTLFCCVASTVLAQSNLGSIRGTVLDSSSGAIVGAKIEVRESGTNRGQSIVTGPDGSFSVSSLRPVIFEITASADGFRTTKLREIKVDTAKATSVEITLTPGSVQESVTVTASGASIQTESGAISATVNQRSILDTPLNGRNVLELALTLPGVAGNAGSEIGSNFNSPPIPGREIIVNGGRPGTTQFIADGQNVTGVGLGRTAVSFSPDTIQEFTILQSNYSAQYSQAGGGIIQQTTRSGTNELHGTGYWFHRQKAFTANPFLSTRLPQFGNDNRSPLRRQQLGLVAGGPVVIPKLYDGRNKTFFFGSYEPTRQVQGNLGASFERVPTDREVTGDFSQSFTYDSAGNALPYPVMYNHFSKDSDGTLRYLKNSGFDPGMPVNGNNPQYQYLFGAANLFNPNDPDPARRGRVLVDALGRSYVNPVAANIARTLYPRANMGLITSGPNAGANYAYFPNTQNRDDRYSVKMDHRIGDKHTIYGRYTYQPLFADRYFRDPSTNPGTSDTSKSRQILMSSTTILSPRLVNEARAGYVYGNFARNFPSEFLKRDAASEFVDIGGAGKGFPNLLGFGIPDFYSNGGPAGNQVGFGRLGMNGIQNVGRNTEHSYNVSDDLTWTHGRHTIRAGFLSSLQQSNAAAPGYGYQAGGRWNFAGSTANGDAVGCGAPGATTSLPADCHNATARTGDNFGAFLLGTPNSLFAYENVAQPYYYRWWNIGSYVQDDWKVSRNFTINIGLRHQYQSPRWEKFNRQGTLNLNRQEANPFNGGLASPVFEFAGYGGRSKYLTPAHYKDFEPRFGFAWQPFRDKRSLVIRGGYGITHSILTGRNRVPFPNLGGKADAHRQYNVAYGTTDLFNPSNIGGCGLAICTSDVPAQFGYNNVVYQPDPTLFNISGDGTIKPGDSLRAVNGVAQQDKRYAQTGFVFDATSRTPLIQSFSFELQTQVMKNTILTAGWRGSKGSHLFSTPSEINLNPFNATRLVPGYNGASGGRIILMDQTASSSIYHAGILELERRFTAGLQFRANYTWSKSIDDSSGGIEPDFGNLAGQDSGAQTIRGNAPQNSFGTTKERAVSSFNYPHVININALYELPFGRGKQFLGHGRLMDMLVGGFQIAGLSRISSGQPVYLDLGDANQLGVASNSFVANPRPNVIAGQPLKNPDWTPANTTTTPYLNPRAFSVPEPGTFGNAARSYSQLQMPWLRTFDASIFKIIYPFENRRRYIQIRAEGFNVLNAKSFGFSGFGTSLFSGISQNRPGQANRYGNLTPSVWDAIIKRDPAGLQGTPDVGLPQGQVLSPLGVYTDLVNRYNRGFYNFGSSSQNTIQARVLQFAVKFYF